MVQKRKVKNLISIKKDYNGLLTALLVLLWWILCIWAVGLLATSMLVKASTIKYEWVDNKAEVVFDMSFVPENKLSWNVVNNMYLSWKTFYISWWSLLLTGGSNSLITGKNINVLWWESIILKSKNVSILWGKDIKILPWNDNVTVLWWDGNKMLHYAIDVPNVFLWWKSLLKSAIVEWSAIIWWDSNEMDTNSPINYSYILWWKNNRIGGHFDGLILWWDSIYPANNSSNLFVFNDGTTNGNFVGKSRYLLWWLNWSNAFYFIVKNWVWLWMDSLTWWVSSKWAVSLWSVNIVSTTCNNDNVWMMWTWNSCLVWCTSFWAAEWWKWEMVDHSESCKNKCKNESAGKCIVTDGFAAAVIHEDYPSYCVWYANTDKAILCNYNLREGYDNMVFEKKLISSNESCPLNTDANKCVFKCMKRYPTVTPDGKDCTDKNVLSCWTMSTPQSFWKCKWPATYIEGVDSLTSWTYADGKTCGELWSCEWSCKNWYVRAWNVCKLNIVWPVVPFDPIDPRPFDPIDPTPFNPGDPRPFNP